MKASLKSRCETDKAAAAATEFGDNRTILDGTLVFDSANKVSANCMLCSSLLL